MDLMEESLPQSNATPVTKSQYSGVSLIISFLLGISLIVFIQFIASDLTKSLYGETPKTPVFAINNNLQANGMSQYQYLGVSYPTYEQANNAYLKAEVLPYQTKDLLVKTIIYIPLFVLAVILFVSFGKFKPSYKLTSGAFFLAMVVNMLTLLSQLVSYVYQINQRLAVYGISLFLIIVFTITVIYVQDKFRNKTPAATNL
ncbi:MAG: hypothetical protein V1858_04845 [Candidatus Gottesmanbacteria bacterium]